MKNQSDKQINDIEQATFEGAIPIHTGSGQLHTIMKGMQGMSFRAGVMQDWQSGMGPRSPIMPTGNGSSINEIWQANLFYWQLSDGFWQLLIAPDRNYYRTNSIVSIGRLYQSWGWPDGLGDAMANGTAWHGYKYKVVGNDLVPDAVLPPEQIGLDNLRVNVDQTNPRRPVLTLTSDIPFDQFGYYDDHGEWVFMSPGATVVTFDHDLEDGAYAFEFWGIRSDNYQFPSACNSFLVGPPPVQLWNSITILAYPETYLTTGIASYMVNTNDGDTYCKDIGANPAVVTSFNPTGWDNVTDAFDYFYD